MRPFPLIAPTALAVMLLLPGGMAAAQDTPSTPALPDMAAIEQAWQSGDFAFVRSGLEQMVSLTDTALAQYRYGRVLLEGRGGPQDIDAAVIWLQKAVDQNHAEAAALLARIYLSELDQDEPIKTKRSPERAADLLTLSATLGFAEGQFQLARLYSAGIGVARDDTAAFRWLLAAGRQQNVKAQFALARAYSKGLGTDASAQEAIRWLTEAANQGHPRALLSLARAYETGNGVEKSNDQAIALYRQAAERGVTAAQRALGTRLLSGGDGIAQDSAEGLRWLQTAAKGGDPNAMAILGRAYFTGDGVAQDDVMAAKWYSRAAQYDHGRAKVALAAMLESGRGVQADFDTALTLYQRALDIPDGNSAAIRLGQLATSGTLDGRFAPHRMTPWVLAAMQNGTPEAETWLLAQADAGLQVAQSGLAALYLADPAKAAKGAALLQRAARAGDTAAQMRLGQMHMTGDLVDLDYVAAHSWFNIATTLGEAEAAELRATATALMTPEQLAEAQEKTRNWFATEEPQPPKPQPAAPKKTKP